VRFKLPGSAAFRGAFSGPRLAVGEAVRHGFLGEDSCWKSGRKVPRGRSTNPITGAQG
jgi:hypothetical protein